MISNNSNNANNPNISYLNNNCNNTYSKITNCTYTTNSAISHYKPKLVHTGNSNILDYIEYIHLINTKIPKRFCDFFVYYFEDPYQTHQKANNKNFHTDGRRFISEDVITAISNALKDPNEQVRMTAITTLGKIAAPEAILALEGILACTKDNDIDIVTKALWVITEIAFACDNSIIPFIIETLKSKYWKIKIASMHAIGKIGERCVKQALPYLLNLFYSSAINKDIIADTIVKLGIEAENSLISIIKKEPDSKYKIKSIVLRAFALANIKSPKIDFIVELLYNASQ